MRTTTLSHVTLVLAALGLAAPAARASDPTHWHQDTFTLEVVAPGHGEDDDGDANDEGDPSGPGDEHRITAHDLLRAVEGAAETWNQNGVGPQIVVVMADPHTQGGFHLDGHNTVSLVTHHWMDNPQAAALTQRSIQNDVEGAHVIEVDARVNCQMWAFVDGAERDALDLQSVLTHELGHTLGLIDDFDHDDATMFYGSHANDISKRDLAPEDTGALDALYAGVVLADPAAPPSGVGCASSGVPGSPAALALMLLGLKCFRARRASRES